MDTRQQQAQELLRAELERLDRRNNDQAIAEFCRELSCKPGEVGRKICDLRKELQDAEFEIAEFEDAKDDLEEANVKLTDEIDKLRQRSVDIGKVEQVLAKLKEAGSKVVDLHVTIEIEEPEKS
jgi:chromosome segregation ATPase